MARECHGIDAKQATRLSAKLNPACLVQCNSILSRLVGSSHFSSVSGHIGCVGCGHLQKSDWIQISTEGLRVQKTKYRDLWPCLLYMPHIDH